MKNSFALEDLSLWNNHINDDGAICLAHVLATSNSTLRILSLVNNEIGDEGAEELAKMLRQNKTITELYLGYNQITDKGVQKLAQVLEKHNRTLKIFSLTSNPLITDLSVNHLQQMLQTNDILEQLLIDDCQLSFNGKQRLQMVQRTTQNRSVISAR